jgi:hypothetical protein
MISKNRAYKPWTYSSRVFWVKIIDELESSKREFAAEDCWLLEESVEKKINTSVFI